jgi:C-terminal processing protease CtpA/Prc
MNILKQRDMKTVRFGIIILLGLVWLASCNDKEDVLDVGSNSDFIKDWIYTNMDYWYLWTEEMPTSLNKNDFDNVGYFEALLNKPTDRWSFITDDYESLNASFQGVNKTMGWNLSLFSITGTTEVMALVTCVFDDSPAKKAGLKRGDIITEIDGVTPNKSNYKEKFSLENMTVSLGYLSSNTIYDANKTVDLTAVEMYQNPILVDTVYTYGTTKVAYLCFESFIPAEITNDLDKVFEDFKTKGASELILDLRYNGGGYVSVATELASMIVPDGNVGKVFTSQVWSSNAHPELVEAYGSDYNKEFFVGKSNRLDLNRVYILSTERTASASELVMNGLEPYMDVVVIGEKSHGKYTGSITIYDTKKQHNWAMQPIVLKSANAEGLSDYGDGLAVDVEALDGSDDYKYLLGDTREFLLNRTLQEIGVVEGGKAMKSTGTRLQKIGTVGRPEIGNGMISDIKIEVK